MNAGNAMDALLDWLSAWAEWLGRVTRLGSYVPLALAVAAFGALLVLAPFAEPLENKAYDYRLSVLEALGVDRGEPTGGVVVVGMEESKLIGEKPLIFWYPEIGRMLLRLSDAGARGVGIDLIPVHALGEKIADAAVSIMEDEIEEYEDAEDFLDALGEATDNSLMGPMILASENMTVIQGLADAIVPYYYPMMAFMENVRGASVRLTPDADTVVRRQMLDSYTTGDGTAVEPFPLALYRLAEGADAGAEQPASVILNYGLLPKIPYHAFPDMLDPEYDLSGVAGKVVLVGYITEYADVHFVPPGRRIPGVFIHAVTIETMLSGTAPQPLGRTGRVALLAALCLMGLAIAWRMGPFAALGATAAAAVAYSGLNLYALGQGTLLPLVPDALGPLAVFTLVSPYRYLVEERSRRKLYKTFSYYVDQRIVDTLIERDAEHLMRGESKDLCILFSDIRSFTMLSNRCRADQVIGFLNVYFSRFTGIIQAHGGIVDKFVGDAVMAYFLPEGNPSVNALKASAEVMAMVRELNETRALEPYISEWKLAIGIGVHHGRVIMGNVGSEKKMDFTIMGEPVNIASRIEGLTKTLGEAVVCSEDVKTMAEGHFQFRHLGLHPIRGLEKGLDLYTIVY